MNITRIACSIALALVSTSVQAQERQAPGSKPVAELNKVEREELAKLEKESGDE